MRMPVSPNSENFRSSKSRSPDGSSAASLMSYFCVRRMPKVAGALPPMIQLWMLPAASRPRSEIASSIPASGEDLNLSFDTRTSDSRLLLSGSLRMPAGVSIGVPRASTPSRAKSNFTI